MLTKLISHEWKDTFKVPALLLTSQYCFPPPASYTSPLLTKLPPT